MQLIALFVVLFFLPLTAHAATVTATGCSLSEVQTAYSTAVAGDTVAIPACSATWSNSLNVTKEITIQGAGKNNTVITFGGSGPLINIQPTSNLAIRVTGLGFQLGGETGSDTTAIYVSGSKNGSLHLTKLRIDNNKFTSGLRGIFVSGWSHGVIDHNEFVNGYEPIFFVGDDNYVWNRPIQAGTADAMFIEGNSFVINNAVETNTRDSLIYIQEGASVVVRHNTFDATAFTNQAWMSFLLNNHGNQNYYTGGTDFRGQPMFEFYNNTASAYKAAEFIRNRGGSILIHDNTFSVVTGGSAVFMFSEEESYQTQFFSHLDTAWPAEDQINNSFLWNNTFNGNPVTSTDVSLDTPYQQQSIFIQEDRDYFLHAPEASGGKESWPDRQGSANMTFTPTGANAYYPYTPYVYPHPLTKDVVVPPTDTTPPVVALTSPTDGTTLSGNVLVAATATDDVGVVGVQFMLDSANLGIADLTSPYSLTWITTATSNGAHTLTAVAMDAAGNLGTSLPCIVTVDNPTTETIWGTGSPGADVAADGSAWTLGTKFSVTAAGKVTGVRLYAATGETGNHVARIWQGSTLVSGPYTFTATGGGWVTFNLPTPLSVSSGYTYTVAVTTGTDSGKRYSYKAYSLATGGNNGAHVAYPANAGVYSSSVNSRPTLVWQSSNYFRDILFVPN